MNKHLLLALLLIPLIAGCTANAGTPEFQSDVQFLRYDITTEDMPPEGFLSIEVPPGSMIVASSYERFSPLVCDEIKADQERIATPLDRMPAWQRAPDGWQNWNDWNKKGAAYINCEGNLHIRHAPARIIIAY